MYEKNYRKAPLVYVKNQSNLFLHLCKKYNVLGSITFEYISGKKEENPFTQDYHSFLVLSKLFINRKFVELGWNSSITFLAEKI